MQMENKVTNEPDMAKLQDYQKGQSEPVSAANEGEAFDKEDLLADHTDYETDWSEFDIQDTGENAPESDDPVIEKIGGYNQEIEKLKKKKAQHINHYARMRNKLKGELRKDRNARLVMWGAEFEYQIGKRCPSLKKLLPYLDRDLQKKIIWHIFAEIRTGPLIIGILKDYTKDITAELPDDLKPYAE